MRRPDLVESERSGWPEIRERFLAGDLRGETEYVPSEHPQLLRDFYSLGADPEEYRTFVREYGRLGGPMTVTVAEDPVSHEDVPVRNLEERPPFFVLEFSDSWESTMDWQIESLEMRACLGLLRILRSGDTAELADRLEVEGDRVKLKDPYGELTGVARRITDETMVLYIHGRPFTYATTFENETTTSSSKPGVALRAQTELSRTGRKANVASAWRLLELVVAAKLEGSVAATFGTAGSSSTPQLRVRPTSLIGYLWLQFAREIGRGSEPRVCNRSGCTTAAFLPNPNSKRGHDTYCSDACRQATYRKRKEAREFQAQGMRARSIAARMKVPLADVQGWIKGESTRKRGHSHKRRR